MNIPFSGYPATHLSFPDDNLLHMHQLTHSVPPGPRHSYRHGRGNVYRALRRTGLGRHRPKRHARQRLLPPELPRHQVRGSEASAVGAAG